LKPPPSVSIELAGDPPPSGLAALFDQPIPTGHTSQLTDLAFSPDGATILTGSYDSTARRWDAATGRSKGATPWLRGSVMSAILAPDGRSAYVGTQLNNFNFGERGAKETLLSMVYRWEFATGKVTRILKDQDTSVLRMSLSPNGRRLAVVSMGNGLEYQPTKANPLNYTFVSRNQPMTGIWDTTTGELLTRLPATPQYYNAAVPEFSPDGRTILYSAGQRNELGIYDAATGERRRPLLNTSDPNWSQWSSTVFSPDGRSVAARRLGTGTVWFWSPATGDLLGSYPIPDGNRGGETILRFTPDSKRVVVGSDRVVHVVDVATRALERTLRGHDAKVNAVALSKDGSRLLTGSDDKSAILWELATGRILAVYKGHSAPVTQVAYSPDGTRVATAAADPVARVWPVDLIPVFEKRKPRELTQQERDRFELPAK
jgi:WD40 repeat protein